MISSAFLRFWTWFIIANGFVPIRCEGGRSLFSVCLELTPIFFVASLYVSLELVQFVQGLFIGWDKDMSYEFENGRFYARAQTSRLNEECAQV